MFPGPVFQYELLTLSRRRRFYALRFLFGAFLLFLVWVNDPRKNGYHPPGWDGELSITEARGLAETLFAAIATTLGASALVLTPPLVAGVIADEKQRKTLHYLMASCLSSAEIVAGKLAARLVLISVLLGLSIPILVLLSLFGGVDPQEVGLFGLCCATTTVLIASAAVLASVHGRSPKDVIASVYAAEVLWLFGPSLVAWVLPWAGGAFSVIYQYARPLNVAVGWSSPFFVFSETARRFGARQTWSENFLWMAFIQTAFAAALLAVAVLRLRPVFRREGDSPRRAARAGPTPAGRRRFFGRRPCGDDAMIWKELHVARNGARSRVVGTILVLVAMAFFGYFVIRLGGEALDEVLAYGYGKEGPASARSVYSIFLRVAVTMIVICWVLGAGTSASSGVTGEREADTWVSLSSTPLTAVEILRAKMLGALWSTRWLGLLWLFLVLTGVALGSIHPVAFFWTTALTMAYVSFGCATGTFYSVRSRTSSRAMIATVGTLFFVNGVYLLPFIPFRVESTIRFFGVMPFLTPASLTTYGEVDRLFATSTSYLMRDRNLDVFVTGIASFLAYASGAVALTVFLSQFDDLIDRPRYFGRPGRRTAHGKDDLELIDEL